MRYAAQAPRCAGLAAHRRRSCAAAAAARRTRGWAFPARAAPCIPALIARRLVCPGKLGFTLVSCCNLPSTIAFHYRDNVPQVKHLTVNSPSLAKSSSVQSCSTKLIDSTGPSCRTAFTAPAKRSPDLMTTANLQAIGASSSDEELTPTARRAVWGARCRLGAGDQGPGLSSQGRLMRIAAEYLQ